MNLLDILFPKHCPYCDCLISHKLNCCESCKQNFPKNIFTKNLKGTATATTIIAPFTYQGQFSKAIKLFKFNNRVDFGQSLAAEMCNAIIKAYNTDIIDYITAVPLSKSSLYKRGYNQSELLAKHIHKRIKVPYKALLIKTKDNFPQHSLNREQRKKNVIGVYSTVKSCSLSGKTILLIDDIATTGYTLHECANTLYKCGAKKVICCTFTIRY